MRKILIPLLIIFYLFSSAPVLAHLPGQPPFFKINGIYSNLYPVPSTSLEDFNLPQDLAAENYLVGEPLNFELDVAVLPVLTEIVNQTKFTWDFGDGSVGTGLKNTHTYTKAGSYVLSIKAAFGSDQPQLIQSVMLHILPSKDYQLPEYKISVNNGQNWITPSDPLVNIIKADFRNELEFKRAILKKGSGEVKSVFWDFGDTESFEQTDLNKNPLHKYNTNLNQVFPVLRITDKNGFISDSFVQINNDNTPAAQKIINNLKNPQTTNNKWLMLGLGVLILGIIYSGFFVFRKISRKRK